MTSQFGHGLYHTIGNFIGNILDGTQMWNKLQPIVYAYGFGIQLWNNHLENESFFPYYFDIGFKTNIRCNLCVFN